MIDIAYEPLSKSYSSTLNSRSFCLPYLCYVMTVIIPALVLINLQCTLILSHRLLARIQQGPLDADCRVLRVRDELP